MTGFSRRDMLGAAATGGMVAAATGTETFGQGQPPFGPTPAPLAGTELPSFRFQLGAVAPKTWDGATPIVSGRFYNFTRRLLPAPTTAR